MKEHAESALLRIGGKRRDHYSGVQVEMDKETMTVGLPTVTWSMNAAVVFVLIQQDRSSIASTADSELQVL